MLAKMHPDKLKMHQKAFGGRALPIAYSAPQPPSRNQGVLLLRGGEGEKGYGRGRDRKGKRGEGTNLPSPNPGSAAEKHVTDAQTDTANE